MIIRIPQRTQDDCAICTVAMVLGHTYSYGRVLADSVRYPKTCAGGRFYAWWKMYFRDEGFDSTYGYFDGLRALRMYGGDVVGMLGMDVPHLKRGHIVAVDEFGVVDPAENAPDDVPIDDYVWNGKPDGVIFTASGARGSFDGSVELSHTPT